MPCFVCLFVHLSKQQVPVVFLFNMFMIIYGWLCIVLSPGLCQNKPGEYSRTCSEQLRKFYVAYHKITLVRMWLHVGNNNEVFEEQEPLA